MHVVPALRRGLCVATLLSIAAVSAVPVALAQGKKEPSYYGPQPATESVDLNMYAQIRAEGLGHSHVMGDITEPLFSRYTEQELKEMEGPEQPRAGRAGAPNIQQLLADRARLTALRTAALKMMTEEGVVAIISPSRDGGKGGGSGII